MTEPTGQKYDAGKSRIGLISDFATYQEAAVMTYGAKKYADHNWRGGMKWSRLIDAALRHIHAFNAGENMDPETGLSHLAHARCCLAFLLEYSQTHPELDDRYNFIEAVSEINNKKIQEAEIKKQVREADVAAVPPVASEGEVRGGGNPVYERSDVQPGLASAQRDISGDQGELHGGGQV